MASSLSSIPGKHLRLKDFLQEDGTNVFLLVGKSEHTVRYVLGTELGKGAGGENPMRNIHAKAAMRRITAVINAIKLVPFSSWWRSLRKRKKENHPGENERIGASMIAGRDLGIGSSGDGVLNMDSAESNSSSCGRPYLKEDVTPTNFSKQKGEEKRRSEAAGYPCNGLEEAEQLSPVAVLDFPCEDDEKAVEPSLSDCDVADIERTTQLFPQKQWRFEGPAAPPELVDSTENAQLVRLASALLWELERRRGVSSAAENCGRSTNKLLLDFFVEELTYGGHSGWTATKNSQLKQTAEDTNEKLLRAAEAWIDGFQPEWRETDRWEACSYHADEIPAQVIVALLEAIIDDLTRELFEKPINEAGAE